ncbi:serine hydrolase domain-containing protein [Alkalihalobacterium bogoriense]|uniref:serine hydrolase domain-containing protein n=1 Tax=Alkalihalobacterium bogoriense TaxID=246272 RepID=UPI00047E1692|nr:serine hydrolase domain-containing protein [Alkalihalobacterium bogoriense]
MKKTIVLLVIILYLSNPINAFANTDDTRQKIEKYIENSLETYNIPGASLKIIKNGDNFYEGNWGIMSNGSSVTSDTPFLIGSLSKPITALAIMTLVEDGKIKLDEPIQTYIPSFTYQTKSSQKITVLHLLEHTSGIRRYDSFNVTDMERESMGAIAQAVTELSGVELFHEPGEVYEYNSANYLLLGAIVEKVTNQTFSEYLNQSIFTPLNMNHSAADYKGAVDKGYVSGFESWFGKPIKSDGFYDNAGAPYGYLASSTNDLSNFLTFMLEGGDLLSEQYLELIKSPPKEGKTYGLGWRFYPKEHFLFHGGATSDFRAEMFFIPEQEVAVVLLTNKYHIMDDYQVYSMVEGIRSIMKGTEPIQLSKPSYSLQWIILGATILLAALTVIHIIIRRKKIANKKWTFSYGVFLFILAVAIIPILTYVMNSPWRTIRIFAPDVALLVHILVVIVATNGIVPFVIKSTQTSYK